MLASESTAIQTAITRMQQTFLSTSVFQPYLSRWIKDAVAESNGYPLSEVNAGQSVGGMIVCTTAALPTVPPPALNDEAIVTDANATTNGTTVVGGGANRVLVRYNGTNWLIV